MTITRKDLQDALHEQTEELAQLVKHGFDGMDKQLASLRAELDVSKQLAEHERKFRKLEQTLNTQL